MAEREALVDLCLGSGRSAANLRNAFVASNRNFLLQKESRRGQSLILAFIGKPPDRSGYHRRTFGARHSDINRSSTQTDVGIVQKIDRGVTPTEQQKCKLCHLSLPARAIRR
jgi:hypothetical protein